MTTAELKEYLGMVVQMEKDVDVQERLCQELSKKEEDCGDKISYYTDLIAKTKKPVKPDNQQKNKKKSKDLIVQGLITFALTMLALWILAIADTLMPALSILFAILGLGAFFIMATSIGMFLKGLFDSMNAEKKDEQIYKKALKEYKKDDGVYESVQKDGKQKITQLTMEKYIAEIYHQQVRHSLLSSKQTLEKLYSHNVIFPKYRNYVMVSSIYEYICAGRCTTLDGHEGAYNILELEIRLDRIITQLDAVLRDLSAIRANQYTLYSCLQEANQKIDTLLQEESRMADSMQALGAQSYEMNRRLGELQHSSELANYLAECNQRELHYMNRMNYLAGHYDNPYGNYTPV